MSRLHRRRRHDGRDREHQQRGEQPAAARPRSPSGSRPTTPASARARGPRSRACTPNSCTIGSETDWMPCIRIAMPTTPATRSVENPAAASAATDALADLREHVGEHEHQQQRLEDRARDELLERLPQHDEVAQDQRAERDARRGHRLAVRARAWWARSGIGGRGHSRRSFPVRLMKTVSSVGSVIDRSETSKPWRSAAPNDQREHAGLGLHLDDDGRVDARRPAVRTGTSASSDLRQRVEVAGRR